jgi:hypothetical protein
MCVTGAILEDNWGKVTGEFNEPQPLGNGPADTDDEVRWHEKVIHTDVVNAGRNAGGHGGSLQPRAEP